jgi:hypothetical protein
MARDISKRLTQLRTRRGGMDRLARLSVASSEEVIRKSKLQESWQKRALNQPYTQYTLGSMQEVDAEYTRISIETAERVGNQLKKDLNGSGILVDFRLQGSVPLNVHIRGVSDVDLLTLKLDYFTYYINGPRASTYTSGTSRTSLEVLSELRRREEEILSSRFPSAIVDKSGGKAISISGGSLARPVDVVPSHWVDTVDYQYSGVERDRGVTILDKKIPETLENLPFLHIFKIDCYNGIAMGGLKKAIRLCKNVKNDAIEEGREINFSSFDIAATMYHSDLKALARGANYELSVLAETQRFLDELSGNERKAKSLDVPDGSRKIFDNENKYKAMKALSIEMNDLAREVVKEQNNILRHLNHIDLNEARVVLGSANVL